MTSRPSADTTAIILSERSTLDLNGFAIEGVTVCSANSTTTFVSRTA